MLGEHINRKLDHWQQLSLTRTRIPIDSIESNTIVVADKTMVNFASNDYLGLGKHSKILEAFTEGVKQYGFGSGASAMVAGFFSSQQRLEARFAEWLGTDRALLFSSGYLANLGVMQSLIDRSCTVLSDKACHASLLDGIQLSRAKHYRYQHNSLTHLKKLLGVHSPELVVTESVFSMSGDIASIKAISKLCTKAGTSLIIDDAHGIGVLGQNGGGICEQAKISQNQFTCIVAPLGKAFNAMGAIVAGNQKTIEAILQFARSYRYSTALSPAISCALWATLDLVIKDAWRRDKLSENMHIFIEIAKNLGLSLSREDITPIKSIIIGDSAKTMAIQQQLMSKGFYTACIRTPSVPKGVARLRLSLNCHHTRQQINDLLEVICKLMPC